MNIKDIKLIIENGGCELNKLHIDILFEQIERTNDILRRIVKICDLNNSHHDFKVIGNLADTFIIED